MFVYQNKCSRQVPSHVIEDISVLWGDCWCVWICVCVCVCVCVYTLPLGIPVMLVLDPLYLYFLLTLLWYALTLQFYSFLNILLYVLYCAFNIPIAFYTDTKLAFICIVALFFSLSHIWPVSNVLAVVVSLYGFYSQI